jgi:hypothetical protein
VTWHDDKVVTARGARVLGMVGVSEHNNCLTAYSTQLGYQSNEIHHHHQDESDEGVWMPILESTVAGHDAYLLHVLIEVNYLVRKKFVEHKVS